MPKELKNTILTIIVNFIYSVIFIVFLFYVSSQFGFIEWLEYDSFNFLKHLIIFLTLFLLFHYIVNLISIILHEIGHLIFGLNAKLKFNSLSILNMYIYKEDKLKIKFDNKLTFSGIKGYCDLSFDDNIKYNNNKIILYYLGGIIINFILVVLFLLIFVLSLNKYIRIISLLFIVDNSYLILYNLIPFNKSGFNTDGMQIKLYLENPDVIKTYSKLCKIQLLFSKGYTIKEMDKNLFCKPKKYDNYSDLLLSLFYIDYLTEYEKYDEVIKYIDLIQDSVKNILGNDFYLLLKSQKILSLVLKNNDLEEVTKIYDKEVFSYLKSIEKQDVNILPLIYLYYKLSKDDKNSNEYKEKFNKWKLHNSKNPNLNDLNNLFEKIDKLVKN